jgi:hypothetical protein
MTALCQTLGVSRNTGSPWVQRGELPQCTSPHTDAVRHVGSAGTIRWQQQRLFLSEVLAGEPVGFYHRACGLWEVQLGPLTVHLPGAGLGATLTLSAGPVAASIRLKVLPMSSV